MESLPVEMRIMIMKHLSNAELLSLSLVNKLLNYEARSFLRDRASVTARLKSTYKDLASFTSDLEIMNIVLFSGICVQLCPEEHRHWQVCLCQPSRAKNGTKQKLVAGFSVIRSRMPLKRLEVTLNGFLDATYGCPALLLVKEILQSSYCDVLEEFSLADNRNLLRFIQEVVRDSRFPRLKILKFESDLGDGTKTLRNFIKQMAARAPNLKEVHQQKEMDYLLKNPLEGTSAALVSDYDFQPLTYKYSERVAGLVKLRRMALQYHVQQSYYLDGFSVEIFHTTIRKMVATSFDTLTSLSVDLVLTVPLMGYGIRLKNVTNLKIFIFCHFFKFVHPSAQKLLQRLDFTQIFPKLDKVEIEHALVNQNLQEDCIVEFIAKEIKASKLKAPRPGRAANIKHVLFRESFMEPAVPSFGRMFPDIEKLELLNLEGRQAPYQLIWKHWPDLKEVDIRKYGSIKTEKWNENLDSVFCGIFPAEVAHLREQDDEYLRAVNIVPVMPSLTCLKALRTLRFYYADKAVGYDGIFMQKIIMTDPSMFIFSNVTGLIAFQRNPNLSVKIGTDSREIYEALRNMKPYAMVGCSRVQRFKRARVQ